MINLILEQFLLEIQSKMVKKIRGDKNESFKCESVKEFNEAIMKIHDRGLTTLAMVLDLKENVIYVVDRSSFHLSLSETWGFPYNEKSKRYIFCTGNYSEDRGFKVNELSIKTEQRKAFKEADSSWIKRIIRVTL